ncbi:MAG: deoxyribonuclease IV, partial [Deltaproteobacteria bacterium]|nr:deoxyribonuclease IV [Deltaproteobacteria bacterium]
MILLGAHMSIAGGVDKAIERAIQLSCTAFQLFTKNATQWKGKVFGEDEIARFLSLRKKSSISKILAHNSYLINLGSGSPALRTKSINALINEMERCRILCIPYIIMHPGAHLGIGEDEGIKNIINSINLVFTKTDGWPVDIALETTAGQGTSIGCRFEQLSRIIDGVKHKERLKVCLDTCHIFAAGYDISTAEGYAHVMKEFDRVVGIDRLVCFHVNDCKKGLGSRVDRHEHIGKGALGQLPFRLLMNDKR